MLAPDQRSSYTDALRPPPGWHFDQAVAATYSLDLTTLLAFPLQLALDFADREGESVLTDGVVLLEALRRTTDRLTVFCEQGQIHAPRIGHMLFSLLEPVIVSTRAPYGGAFHPKLWLLRYTSGSDSMLRLVLPTRNITTDRCWDLVLALEGMPTSRPVGANRPLRQFIEALPEFASSPPSTGAKERLAGLADEVHRTRWDLPSDFEEIRFHALGLSDREWLPHESSRLAVISPFLSGPAVEALAGTSAEPVALISRAEQMAEIPADTLRAFDTLYVLHESTDPDDAEEQVPTEPARFGLHAKAYVLECGRDTHVFVGSANATGAGLFGQNVEILAELIGRRSSVGGIDELLSIDAMGAVVTKFDPPPEPVVLDSALQEALACLRAAQRDLAEAELAVEITPVDEERYEVVLRPAAPVPLQGIRSIDVWPVSLRDAVGAVDASGLRTGDEIVWPPSSILSLTGFIAFEITAAAAQQSIRFVLRLPVVGLPSEARDTAIIRSILANRDGFLRYLLLLLGDDELFFPGMEPPAGNGTSTAAFGTWYDGMPLLEEMTRALHRDPPRLRAVKTLMKQLGSRHQDDIVPREFLELWLVFEEVLAEVAS